MFRLVTGNNGRTIYFGTVSKSKEDAFVVEGTDWNSSERKEESFEYQVSTDKELMSEKYKGANVNIAPGSQLMVTVMPHRKIANYGIGEEIAHKNQVLSITNENGNEKYCIYGVVRFMKWNDAHNRLQVSFTGLTDYEMNPIGYESRKEENGQTTVTHWFNVVAFNTIEGRYNADHINKEIGVGDTVVMVVTRKISMYQGKEYENFNVAKYVVLDKAATNNNAGNPSNLQPKQNATAPATQQASQGNAAMQTAPQGYAAPATQQAYQPQAQTTTMAQAITNLGNSFSTMEEFESLSDDLPFK